jgi:hypothetical protein
MPEFEANDNPSLRRLQARPDANSKRLDSAARRQCRLQWVPHISLVFCEMWETRLSTCRLSAIIAVIRRPRVKARVSHISQKTSEIWGTHCFVALSTGQGNAVGYSPQQRLGGRDKIQARILSGLPSPLAGMAALWANPLRWPASAQDSTRARGNSPRRRRPVVPNARCNQRKRRPFGQPQRF